MKQLNTPRKYELKEWEIVEWDNSKVTRDTLRQGDTGYLTNEAMIKRGYKIKSVKRLSDREVFSIGDTVCYLKQTNPNWVINEFFIRLDSVLIVRDKSRMHAEEFNSDLKKLPTTKQANTTDRKLQFEKPYLRDYDGGREKVFIHVHYGDESPYLSPTQANTTKEEGRYVFDHIKLSDAIGRIEKEKSQPQNKEDIISKGINEMTIEDFRQVEHVEWGNEVRDFDSLVVLPESDIHDSDFRVMSFIACKGDSPICKIGGGSDMIHINGIGGCGYNWLNKYGTVPKELPIIAWSIDCLKGSGLLRLFNHNKLIAGRALSSFEIFNDDDTHTKN